MPPAPLTGDGVTGIHDQAVAEGRGGREALALLPRRAGLLRRVAGRLRPAPRTGDGYRDPLFEQPDLVEDDYRRFRQGSPARSSAR